MPSRLPIEVVARIKNEIRDANMNLTKREIQRLAVDFKTTERTIYSHLARIRASAPLAKLSGGPRRVITWEIEQAIKLLLNTRPWYYQDEICDFLHEVFNVEVVR